MSSHPSTDNKNSAHYNNLLSHINLKTSVERRQATRPRKSRYLHTQKNATCQKSRKLVHQPKWSETVVSESEARIAMKTASRIENICNDSPENSAGKLNWCISRIPEIRITPEKCKMELADFIRILLSTRSIFIVM